MPAIAIPAPTGGWNASDSLDRMPATDAVRLVNWIPRAGFVQSRPGFVSHVSGLGGSVESLMAWRGPTGDKLLAGANGNLWDVTTTTPTSLGAGFSANDWNSTNHTGRLILTNGVSTPQVYNGTTLTAMTATGPTLTTLWGCNTFKGRAYYWARNAQSFWYAAAGAYQGTLTQFFLDTQLTTGGSLVQMLNWTNDAGDGVDDYAVFVFSTGEVLVYQGDDPGSATAWALIGRFQIGEPLGIKAHAKVGGTEIIVTRDGYVDLSAALRDGRYSEQSAYSAKIIRAAKDATNEFGGFTGWEAQLFPAGQLFIVNVPTSSTTAIQHVRETSSGGWCEFRGWNARCFAVLNNRLWFGTSDGRVNRAYIGTIDGTARIESWAIPAFNALGSKAQRKQVTAVSVVSNALRPSSYAYDGLADFNTTLRATLTDDAGSPAAVWDSSAWDASAWGVGAEGLPVRQAWRNVSANGYALTVSVRIRQQAQAIIWYSTNYQFRQAGTL